MRTLFRLLFVGALSLLAAPVAAQTLVVPDCATGISPGYSSGSRNVPYAISINGQPCGGSGGAATITQNDGQTNATASGAVSSFRYVYNGATWDRARSPQSALDGNSGIGVQAVGNNIFNGTNFDREFACTQSAVVNVTAAATTELVPLTASQTIRVCSFVVTGSAAATVATFVYGTGANCATGQTALTGAMRIAIDNNITLSAGKGSLFRTAVANALCLTAVTGNVTGFVTYAKF